MPVLTRSILQLSSFSATSINMLFALDRWRRYIAQKLATLARQLVETRTMSNDLSLPAIGLRCVFVFLFFSYINIAYIKMPQTRSKSSHYLEKKTKILQISLFVISSTSEKRERMIKKIWLRFEISPRNSKFQFELCACVVTIGWFPFPSRKNVLTLRYKNSRTIRLG